MLIDVRIPLGAGFSSFLNCANAQYETETNQESEVAGTTTYLEHKCDKKEEKNIRHRNRNPQNKKPCHSLRPLGFF